MSGCLTKIGFLSLRDCAAPAVALCITCHRPLCQRHARHTPQGKQCPECFLSAQPEQDEESPLGHLAEVARYYRDHQYTPPYWGVAGTRTGTSSETDYAAFDAAALAEALQESFNADDLQDS